jgi:hypothetical protein
VEPNQVHARTGTVFRGLEQVLHTVETRLAREIICDVADTNRRYRIHHNLSIVHSVTTARFDMGTQPDADAASDPAAADSLANAFGEHHALSRLN